MTVRLPLRVVPQAQLRAAWSAGHTFYQYEGLPPRATEKPIEAMTLDELIATQNTEPLSESRRSFLATRQGVLSLDAPASPGSAISLIEFVGDDAPKCLFDAIDDGLDLDDDLDIAERDARRYGTPYQTVDFVTGRQIEWEREQSQHGPVYRLAIGPTDSGRLTVRNIGRGIITPDPDTASTKEIEDYWDMTREQRSTAWFRKIATSALRSLFESVGRVETYTQLRERIDLLVDAMDDPVAAMYRSPDDREERDRYLAEADRIEHSSFEDLDDEGNVIVHHRSPRISEWELWHNELDRNSSAPLELGFDLCSDDELESLLGVTAWDESGYPATA